MVAKWDTLQNASAEIRGLLAHHEELRRGDVQDVLREWVDAHPPDASPELLCARLVKALIDVSAFCLSQPETARQADLRPALRDALGVPGHAAKLSGLH